jgi:calcineurin-like phosphoesterase family protein
MKFYLADTHLSDGKIIGLCQRPYASVEEMDRYIVANIAAAPADAKTRRTTPVDPFDRECPDTLFHLGDIAHEITPEMRRQFALALRQYEYSILVLGNHDKPEPWHDEVFADVVGTSPNSFRQHRLTVNDEAEGRRYRVLISHAPQEHLGPHDLNLYGHHHNLLSAPRRATPKATEAKVLSWLLKSDRHINVSCDVVGFRPRTLTELLQMRRNGLVLK